MPRALSAQAAEEAAWSIASSCWSPWCSTARHPRVVANSCCSILAKPLPTPLRRSSKRARTKHAAMCAQTRTESNRASRSQRVSHLQRAEEHRSRCIRGIQPRGVEAHSFSVFLCCSFVVLVCVALGVRGSASLAPLKGEYVFAGRKSGGQSHSAQAYIDRCREGFVAGAFHPLTRSVRLYGLCFRCAEDDYEEDYAATDSLRAKKQAEADEGEMMFRSAGECVAQHAIVAQFSYFLLCCAVMSVLSPRRCCHHPKTHSESAQTKKSTQQGRRSRGEDTRSRASCSFVRLLCDCVVCLCCRVVQWTRVKAVCTAS